MTEEWRPVKIEGYEELYEVSNTGKVRSTKRKVFEERLNGMSRKVENHYAHFKSRELKPYYICKKSGLVKYHLHRRIKPGRCGQACMYVYANDLVRYAFPELDFNNLK